MSEFLGWVIVLGLAFTIACIFMLSSQLEKHTRMTAEMLFHSNEMLLAQLEQFSNAPLQAPERVVGVVLERTGAQCPDPLTEMSGKSGAVEAINMPHRPLGAPLSA